MEIGIGLDTSLSLSWSDHHELVREAARLGYSSAWTPSQPTSRDAFHVCSRWNASTGDLLDGGIATGISVVPVPVWSPTILASLAGTVGELSGGRFILGIGTGGIYSEDFRRSYGRPAWPPVSMMRDYVSTTRTLLRGESVEHEGPSVSMHKVQLSFRPPTVPVFLAALGPQMLRLAGEVADGAALNWCTPEQIAFSRERVNAGAQKAGRDPAELRLAEYIRICVDEDETAARRAYTRATMGYALGRHSSNPQAGYRAHFGRMGYDADLRKIEEARDRGAPEDELIDAFPDGLLKSVGYYGKPAGAAAAFRRLAEGLDIAIVRVVAARPGLDSVRSVMQACAPQLVVAS
jgi:5,10-methylenetetrahydromethanopterin reductase